MSVSLGVFGRLHSPAGTTLTVPGLSGTLEVKVWATSLAAALALAGSFAWEYIWVEAGQSVPLS